MPKTALVLLAEDSEEMEAVISADTLRRAGIEVVVAGIDGPGPVRCSRNIVITPDVSLKEALLKCPFDAIVLPGGLKGSKNLVKSELVGEALRIHDKHGKVIAGICAAATAFKAHGVCKGKRVTTFPSVKEEMEEGNEYIYEEERVVVDGDVVTSRGPGTSFEYALAVVERLLGKEEAETLGKNMMVRM